MDDVQRAVVAAGAAVAGGIGAGLSAGHRAAAIGHETSIERVDGRFRIVCSCGWQSHRNWTRRHSFEAMTAHVFEVLADEGVSFPGNVAGEG